MLSVFPQLFTYQEIAPVLLRVVLGVAFVLHGYPKLFGGFGATAQFFSSVGIKPAKFWVAVVGIVEFFGGAALLVGIFTQAAALLIAVNMAVALLVVKRKQGFVGGYELDLAFLAMALALLLLGPGLWSIDLPL
ncbi:MAG: DoxX family protein [Parcubacteria group bacterium]|nr:DoxX family protein [Parcubacteria group bacterium]